MKKLKKELCKSIVNNMGLVPSPNFGKVGLTTKDFLIDKTISLEFENELGNKIIQKFGLWCGSISLSGMMIKALVTDICDNDNNHHEFIVTYKLENGPIVGISIIYGEDHNGLFLFKKNEQWKPASNYEMLMAAAGFEKLNDLGIMWKPNKDYEELYDSLIEIIGMG